MKSLLITVLALSLSACATPPRFLAEIYDSADPCQIRNNGGVFPSFCGASGGRVYVYDRPYSTAPAIGYIQR